MFRSYSGYQLLGAGLDLADWSSYEDDATDNSAIWTSGDDIDWSLPAPPTRSPRTLISPPIWSDYYHDTSSTRIYDLPCVGNSSQASRCEPYGGQMKMEGGKTKALGLEAKTGWKKVAEWAKKILKRK